MAYIVEGERVVGYDNAEGKGDHRHFMGKESGYPFRDLRRLVRDFQADIESSRRVTVKVKRVKIGIKGMAEAMDDFVRTAVAVERGEKVKKETGVYFTSLEAFRKVLTPRRMLLLRHIREGRPASLHELARLAQRNIKNVSEDVKYLAQVGLIEMKDSANKVSARVNYDTILLEIAV